MQTKCGFSDLERGVVVVMPSAEEFPTEGVHRPEIKTFSGEVRQRLLQMLNVMETQEEGLKLSEDERKQYRRTMKHLLMALNCWRAMGRPISVAYERKNTAYNV